MGLSATGAWRILTSLGGAAVGDETSICLTGTLHNLNRDGSVGVRTLPKWPTLRFQKRATKSERGQYPQYRYCPEPASTSVPVVS
jgi:hypothetical protein